MPAPRSSLSAALSTAMTATLSLALGLGAAAPAQAQLFGHRKKPEPVVAAPPPAPPVALSDHVVEAASAYRAYMNKAAALSAAFRSGADVEETLVAAEASEPQAMTRGVIAYAALLALQDPAFVAGVRQYARDPAQREQIGRAILLDPTYAAQMPGAPSAAALIIHTLNADGARVFAAGKAVKQSAYDIQRSAWSQGTVPNRDGRLARAKTLSAASMSAYPADMAMLRASIPSVDAAGRPIPEALSAGGATVAPPYTPVVARALAVAALGVLGRAGDDNDPAVQSLLAESSAGFCQNMAKLNLYQCLAVAKPYYEDVFCLGQHVLMDTGQCVEADVGAGAPGAGVSLTTASTGGVGAGMSH